jgi:hypothetical protein
VPNKPLVAVNAKNKERKRRLLPKGSAEITAVPQCFISIFQSDGDLFQDR